MVLLAITVNGHSRFCSSSFTTAGPTSERQRASCAPEPAVFSGACQNIKIDYLLRLVDFGVALHSPSQGHTIQQNPILTCCLTSANSTMGEPRPMASRLSHYTAVSNAAVEKLARHRKYRSALPTRLLRKSLA